MMKLKSIKNGITIIFIIIIVIIITVFAYLANLKFILNDEMNGYLSEVTNQSINVLKTKINSDIEKLNSIAIILGIDENIDLNRAMILLEEECEQNDFKRMGIILKDGNGYTSDGHNFNFSDREYFKKSIKGEANVSDSLYDKIGGEKIIVYSTPIYRDGEISSVLFGTHSVDIYKEMLSVATFGGEGYSQIAKSNGDIILKSTHKQSDKNITNIFENIKSGNYYDEYQLSKMKKDLKMGKSGLIKYRDRGIDKYLNYAHIGINDWYILSTVKADLISEKSKELSTMTLYVCLIVVLCLVTLMFLIIKVKKKNQDKLERLAYYDSVTGIRNSNRFILDMDLLNNRDEISSIICFDIDKFKLINDSFGYDAGNQVLIKISEILKRELSEDNIYARLSNDNFVIGLNGFKEVNEVEYICEKISKEIRNIKYENRDLKISIAIGVYIFSDKDNDITKCIDKAILAKDSVKGNRSKLYAIYNNEIKQKLVKELEIEHDMEEALATGEFKVYLQPKVELSNEHIVGAEALVRWKHHSKGFINPGEFIPVFEKNGFIINIDLFVIKTICKQFRNWIDENKTILPISVNISRSYINDDKFIIQIEEILKQYDIDPALVELEITESAILEDSNILLDIIEKLRKIGFKISMDDFGAGYSSLNMLKDMNIDTLKLDKDFFSSIVETERSKIIVYSIIEMAKKLNIKVLSEGVETVQQAKFLNEIGCDMAQGFLFARPMPIVEYEKLINKLS